MARLSLAPAPTFTAKVGIPVPGGVSEPVEFTFRWRGRKAFVEWLDQARELSNPEAILQMAEGWNLEDAFTLENVERLCDTYAGAPEVIFKAYAEELRGARAKN